MKIRLGNRYINIQTLPEAITLGSNFPATLGPTTGTIASNKEQMHPNTE
jgi:hypothetical protein